MAGSIRVVAVVLLPFLVTCGSASSGGGGSAPSFPAGYQTADIGAVGLPGSTVAAAGGFHVGGSGSDIWDTADAFRFVYWPLPGDGQISARVASLDPTDPWAKAGVMMRETLDPASRFVMTVVTPSNGSSLQARSEPGQGCGLTFGPAWAPPAWVRLSRSGNTFTGAVSQDGSAWTTIASVDVAMGKPIYVGLCVTAHDNGEKAVAQFDSLSAVGVGSAPKGSFDPSKLGPDVYLLQAGVTDDRHMTLAVVYVQVVAPGSIPAGNQPPVINSVSAGSGTTTPFGKLPLSATASDPDGDPLRWLWNVPAGDVTNLTGASDTWTAPSQPGSYTLQAMVTDGHVWTAATVVATVTGSIGTGGTGNHPASIRSFTASSVRVNPGEPVTLNVVGHDPEGNPLAYHWWSATGGTVTPNGATATWTAPAAGSGRPAKAGYWMWERTPPAGCPFPYSTDIPGLAFVGRAASQHFSDTWMPTWAADGDMYSPWQDGVLLTEPYQNLGGWFGGTDPALNGWARIHGDDPQDLLIPSAGLTGAPLEGWQGRYPGAMFHHNGVLYFATHMTSLYNKLGAFTDEWSECWRWAAGPTVGFKTSTDGGQNWTQAPQTSANPLFPEPGPNHATTPFGAPMKFGAMYMVDFGRNQQHSPDGKVYFVSAGSSTAHTDPNHQDNDSVFLCRVTPSVATINDESQYEYWAGSAWSSDFHAAAPIAHWPNHFTGATITWNPGLGKFIMMAYTNGYEAGGQSTPGDHDSFILESGSLTGPWKLITYLKSFGVQAYFLTLPPKFLAGDGRNAWMCYGANYMPFDRKDDPPGSGYRFCLQRIRFMRAEDTP